MLMLHGLEGKRGGGKVYWGIAVWNCYSVSEPRGLHINGLEHTLSYYLYTKTK